MKKIVFTGISILLLFWLFSFVNYQSNKTEYLSDLGLNKAKAATTGTVLLSGTVLEYTALTLTSGTTVDFGNMTPGTDYCNLSGSVASVITSAVNGYTLGMHDGSATNSAMSGATSFIPDMVAPYSAPTVWATGSTTGLGVSLWTGTSALDAQWVVGTTPCAYTDKYAGIPAASTVFRTKTGYSAGADLTSWGWKVNVQNTQATGIYSGSPTFTATAVIS